MFVPCTHNFATEQSSCKCQCTSRAHCPHAPSLLAYSTNLCREEHFRRVWRPWCRIVVKRGFRMQFLRRNHDDDETIDAGVMERAFTAPVIIIIISSSSRRCGTTRCQAQSGVSYQFSVGDERRNAINKCRDEMATAWMMRYDEQAWYIRHSADPPAVFRHPAPSVADSNSPHAVAGRTHCSDCPRPIPPCPQAAATTTV